MKSVIEACYLKRGAKRRSYTQPVFTCSKLKIETLEQCEICSKLTVKIPERRKVPSLGCLYW